MSNIDTEKMKALAAELRANHEAMKSWMPTHQLESSPASKGADAIDTLLDECALLRSRVNALSDLVDSLLAARRACASEFPPDAEGEPDEGRIHENIRKLKAALEAAAADKREEPSLTNPLTPYGMLVRALRIVTGTLLGGMAKSLHMPAAQVSGMEFGRIPVTPEIVRDVGKFFEGRGIGNMRPALQYAANASISQRQEES